VRHRFWRFIFNYPYLFRQIALQQFLGLLPTFKTGEEIYCDANKPRLYALFRFIMAAYIVKCTATRYRRYKDRVEYINIIHSP
jgi:hypothetical protein